MIQWLIQDAVGATDIETDPVFLLHVSLSSYCLSHLPLFGWSHSIFLSASTSNSHMQRKGHYYLYFVVSQPLHLKRLEEKQCKMLP